MCALILAGLPLPQVLAQLVGRFEGSPLEVHVAMDGSLYRDEVADLASMNQKKISSVHTNAHVGKRVHPRRRPCTVPNVSGVRDPARLLTYTDSHTHARADNAWGYLSKSTCPCMYALVYGLLVPTGGTSSSGARWRLEAYRHSDRPQVERDLPGARGTYLGHTVLTLTHTCTFARARACAYCRS